MNSRDEQFRTIIRILTFASSIAILLFSIGTSVDGFGLMQDNAVLAGIALAIFVTVVEFMLNELGPEADLTLKILGGAAYMYGMISTWLGLWKGAGIPLDNNVVSTHIGRAIFYVLLAFVIEFAPELCIKWSLGVRTSSVITRLFSSSTWSGGGGGGSHEPQRQPQSPPMTVHMPPPGGPPPGPRPGGQPQRGPDGLIIPKMSGSAPKPRK